MRAIALLALIALPSAAHAEWHVINRTNESPPYYSVSQNSQPPGLTLGFWCTEGSPPAVTLVSWTWSIDEKAPLTVEIETQRGTKTINFRPTTHIGTPWRPTRENEKELAYWLEQESDGGVTLRLPDKSGNPLTAVYPGALGSFLKSLRGSCGARDGS
ncbi:MAG: hypothetical protein JOY64_19960 [Alphaproteobacteria bacterium]|nr:hypothetical protein [Alphaproteobacteria bacterium]MBV8409913.1 hypothetical protein [Alphaproteobacteria bacterium]